MKIAEALIERASVKADIDALKERMQKNVKIQDGDVAQEDVNALLDEYIKLSDRLNGLICKINKTNQETKNAEGIPLSDMIIKRDTYKSIVKTYKTLYDEGIITRDRYSRNEVKFICTISAEKIQSEIRKYSLKYRELDTEIQCLNWSNDLIE